MKKPHLFISVLIGTMILLSSCSTKTYVKSTPHVSFLEEQGDFRVQGTLGIHNYQAQASVLALKNVGVQMSAYLEDDPDDLKLNNWNFGKLNSHYLESGLGYIGNISPKFRFELFGGLGAGRINSYRDRQFWGGGIIGGITSEIKEAFRTDFDRKFYQATLIYRYEQNENRDDKIFLAFGLKHEFNRYQFYRYHYSHLFFDPGATSYLKDIEENDFRFQSLNPFFQVHAKMYKGFSLIVHGTYYTKKELRFPVNSDILYGMSLNYTFSKSRNQKKVEKN